MSERTGFEPESGFNPSGPLRSGSSSNWQATTGPNSYGPSPYSAPSAAQGAWTPSAAGGWFNGNSGQAGVGPSPQAGWSQHGYSPYTVQRKRIGVVPVIILVIGLLVIGGAVGIGYFASRPNPGVALISDAVEACDRSGYLEISDGGRTLNVWTEGEETHGASQSELDCVVEMLEVPTSVTSRMWSTRALDGMQSGTWGDFEASWNYHPDNGFKFIVTVAD